MIITIFAKINFNKPFEVERPKASPFPEGRDLGMGQRERLCEDKKSFANCTIARFFTSDDLRNFCV